MLENNIRALRSKKDILLMTHLVMGTPSLDENFKLIQAMVKAGVELIELQIPFSEPMADGPVILKANDDALKNGTTVADCLLFAEKVCAEFPNTHFLFMTYSNILFAHGIQRFVQRAKKIGIQGFIVPDMPPEEANDYISACEQEKMNPIFIFTPTNTPERLKQLASYSRGLIYCVGRKGVTGSKTTIDDTLNETINKYRAATTLPLALGFGLQTKEDISNLKGKVDIAVLGTKILTLHKEQGTEAVRCFLSEIR